MCVCIMNSQNTTKSVAIYLWMTTSYMALNFTLWSVHASTNKYKIIIIVDCDITTDNSNKQYSTNLGRG